MKKKLIGGILGFLCVGLIFSTNLFQLNILRQNTISMTRLWKFDCQGRIVNKPVSYRNGVLLQTTQYLYSLDLKGNLSWAIPSAGNQQNTSLIVANNSIIVPEKNGDLVAYDYSGQEKWRDNSICTSCADNIMGLVSDGHSVYVARFSNSISALDVNSGKKNWEAPVPDRTTLYLAISDEYIYLGAGEGVISYKKETGERAAKQNLPGWITAMGVFQDRLIVATHHPTGVSNLALKDLHEKWFSRNDENNQPKINCIASYQDLIMVSSNKLLALLNSDGRKLWVSEKETSLGCPVFHEERIFVKDTFDFGQLIEYSSLDGKKIGTKAIFAKWGLISNNGQISINENILFVPVEPSRLEAFWMKINE